MDNASIDMLISGLAVERAKRKASIGPVESPHQHILDSHGIPFFPGQVVFDSVTSSNAEVVHGGTTNASNPGS